MRQSIAMLLLAGVLSGCYTVASVSSPVLGPDVVAHVSLNNYGWKLFGCIPLVCGNAHEDSWCGSAFFRNDLDPEIAKRKLEKLACEADAVPTDVRFYDDDDVLFNVYYAPIPWIIVYREVSLSANLVRKGGAQ